MAVDGKAVLMLEIYDQIEQGSDEWRRLRAGIPTASEFSALLAKGEGKTRAALMRRLAGERITGEPEETFSNGAMARGKEMEAKARATYALVTDAEPRLVGFVRNGNCGASPDAFLGEDGVLELKTAKPSVLIALLEADRFPLEHIAQCQGALLVTGRQWVDICVFWPGLPMLVKRAYRDVVYLANLRKEIDTFNADLAAMVERIRAYSEKCQ